MDEWDAVRGRVEARQRARKGSLEPQRRQVRWRGEGARGVAKEHGTESTEKGVWSLNGDRCTQGVLGGRRCVLGLGVKKPTFQSKLYQERGFLSLISAVNCRYDGSFRDGVPHGDGRFVKENGDVYQARDPLTCKRSAMCGTELAYRTMGVRTELAYVMCSTELAKSAAVSPMRFAVLSQRMAVPGRVEGGQAAWARCLFRYRWRGTSLRAPYAMSGTIIDTWYAPPMPCLVYDGEWSNGRIARVGSYALSGAGVVYAAMPTVPFAAGLHRRKKNKRGKEAVLGTYKEHWEAEERGEPQAEVLQVRRAAVCGDPAAVCGHNAAVNGASAAFYSGNRVSDAISLIYGDNLAVYGGNAAVYGGNAVVYGAYAAIYGDKALTMPLAAADPREGAARGPGGVSARRRQSLQSLWSTVNDQMVQKDSGQTRQISQIRKGYSSAVKAEERRVNVGDRRGVLRGG
eukprot:1236476-Rhodomonas_salina.1